MFEILINLVEQVVPETYLTQTSYDAIIGMLKWALPLDMHRTFNVLMRSLYERVTLGKIKQA